MLGFKVSSWWHQQGKKRNKKKKMEVPASEPVEGEMGEAASCLRVGRASYAVQLTEEGIGSPGHAGGRS